MKLKVPVILLLTSLLSTGFVFAKTHYTPSPMYVPQISPATGMSNPMFLKLDYWLSQTFGVNEKFIRNSDSIAGKKAYFIITRHRDGTIKISKRIQLKDHDIDVFSGKDFQLMDTSNHPPLPEEVIQHFQNN